MTELEEVVRRALSDQVHERPPMIRPAARAIAGAAAARRRRALLVTGAVVVVLVAVVAGAVVLRPPTSRTVPANTPSPSAVPSSVASPVTPSGSGLSALVGGDSLLLPDGRLVPLTASGDARAAYQVHDGYLVIAAGDATVDSESLWLYHADGYGQRLVDHVSGLLVAPDGRRLAWRSGPELTVAHLDDSDNIVTDAQTQTDRGYPLVFVGSTLVLGYSETGGGIDHIDVWIPQQGPYVPTWDRVQAEGVINVFGPASDGHFALGLVFAAPGSGDKRTCLAQLDPTGVLRVVARQCALPAVGEWGSVSPDGKLLAYESSAQGSSLQTVVVDPGTVFDRPAVLATWSFGARGAWVADTMVAQADNGRIYRYRVGRNDGDPVTFPGQPTTQASIDPIPVLS
jgi:hypothetical protein